jgi:hypothetical protein
MTCIARSTILTSARILAENEVGGLAGGRRQVTPVMARAVQPHVGAEVSMRHVLVGLLALGGTGCLSYSAKTADTYAYDTEKVIAAHNKTQAMIDADTGFYHQAAQSKRIEVQAKADARRIGYF